MVFLLFSYGFLMFFLWFSCGCPMVFLWLSYGFPMVFLWISYCFPMVFIWFSYGVPMLFLWFSYGFPISLACCWFVCLLFVCCLLLVVVFDLWLLLVASGISCRHPQQPAIMMATSLWATLATPLPSWSRTGYSNPPIAPFVLLSCCPSVWFSSVPLASCSYSIHSPMVSYMLLTLLTCWYMELYVEAVVDLLVYLCDFNDFNILWFMRCTLRCAKAYNKSVKPWRWWLSTIRIHMCVDRQGDFLIIIVIWFDCRCLVRTLLLSALGTVRFNFKKWPFSVESVILWCLICLHICRHVMLYIYVLCSDMQYMCYVIYICILCICVYMFRESLIS